MEVLVRRALRIGAFASLGLGLQGCSDSCTDVGCPPKVQVVLPDFSASEGADLLLTACNEGVCVGLAWNPACTYGESERFYAGWCLSDATHTQLSIEPRFPVADGDEFQISITKVGGEVLLEESFAAEYTDATPSGACASCTTATADFVD